MKLRLCFIVEEIFAWGCHGGFGRAARTTGSELVKRGIEVFVVTLRRKNQRPIEKLDGMVVLSFPKTKCPSFLRRLHYPFSRRLYEDCDADIYHSEEPTLGTYMAMKAMPSRKHIVTCQDPRNKDDWKIEYQHYPFSTRIKHIMNKLLTDNLIKRAVKSADAVFCQAKYTIPKVKLMYGLTREPSFLPNAVKVPSRKIKKANEPTVCFLARWDPRKRPEIFFNLAKKFPDVRFIAPGKAHDETWDRYLRRKYSDIPNLDMPGFVSSEQKERILEKSWIMVNTGARECLPVAFLEAAAYKCAILSSNNPDDFADNFGYHVKRDDYVAGLQYLLHQDRWREKGEKGYEYVKKTHELKKVIEKHITIYKKLVSGQMDDIKR